MSFWEMTVNFTCMFVISSSQYHNYWPLGLRFTELQRSWPEQWSHVDEIKCWTANCMALRTSCCLLTCCNHTVRVEHCFWAISNPCVDNYCWWLCIAFACDEMAVWKSAPVTSWSCEEMTAWWLDHVTSWLAATETLHWPHHPHWIP